MTTLLAPRVTSEDTHLRGALLAVAAASLLFAAGLSADEKEIRARWLGAWVVVGPNLYSNCSGSYTDNEVNGSLVSSKGNYRFEPGELAVVNKVNLERKKIEVMLDLAETRLQPRREGPFTLYDEVRCKVELEIALESAKSAPMDVLEDRIAAVLGRHADRDSALAASEWNGRIRDPYPEDYEETLARYDAWKVEQVNAEVAAKIDESLEEAARLVDRLRTDSDSMDGFAAGIEEARGRHLSDDCDRLLHLTEASFVRHASRDSSRNWHQGYEDGQRLVLYVEVGARLQGCFLPPPV